MKKVIAFIIHATVSTFLWAQSPNLQWAAHLSGTDVSASSIEIDADKNVYSVGNFSLTFDADPGPGVQNLSAVLLDYIMDDFFIQKLDSNGNLIWVKSVGDYRLDQANDVAVDQLGNVYVVGYFSLSVDFDPAPSQSSPLTSQGGYDAFVLKLDANGDFVWAKSFRGSANVEANAIAVDANQNVYITGEFRQTADFDPGAGTHNLTSNGAEDIFITKLDAAGDFVWANAYGGTNTDRGIAIEIDPSGNIVTAGDFRYTVDFDPGAGVSNLVAANFYGSYAHKTDANGDLIWVKGLDETNCTALAIDGLGDIILAGDFNGIVDLDPGAGSATFTASSRDAYTLKLTSAGNFSWATTINDPSNSYGYGVAVDNGNNIYTTGRFSGTTDFDPGSGTSMMTGNGGLSDGFVQCLNSNGNYLWAATFGGSQSETPRSIAVDNSGFTYVNGSFTGADADFDPSGGVHILDAGTSSSNGFIAKFGLCTGSPSFATDVQVACGSYTWIDGNTYTSSNNTATYTLSNTAGCDSIITLDLTINTTATSTDVQVACSSYTWIDGNTYTSSNNTATHTLTSSAGCDSIVTLDLTIGNTIFSTDVQTACGSYTWIDGNTYTSNTNTPTFTFNNGNGCDSVVTLNLTINQPTTGIDYYYFCDPPFTWIDGNTYTQSTNTPTYTLTGSNGCDSVVSLNLFIADLDIAVTLIPGGQLESNYNGNNELRWVDCNNDYAEIPGTMNSKVYQMPEGGGSFAAIWSDNNGCADTSACVTYLPTSSPEVMLREVTIYPNPVKEFIRIDQADNVTSVRVYDVHGQLLIHDKQISPEYKLDVSEAGSGILLVELIHDNGDITFEKVVKVE